jgi:hypothetical protein
MYREIIEKIEDCRERERKGKERMVVEVGGRQHDSNTSKS